MAIQAPRLQGAATDPPLGRPAEGRGVTIARRAGQHGPRERRLADVRLIVFDLGGVLLKLREPIANFGVTGGEADFLERWLLSPSVREFESGAIDAAAFAQRMIAELGLPFTREDFLERFDAWPEALYPDALALLDAIPPGVRSALLSNTNAAHWGRPDISGVLSGRFDWEFLSFRTGLLKPDAAAYRHVVETCGVRPEEVLFFDDNPRNVEAAARIGIAAHACTCPADAAAVMKHVLASRALA